MLYVRWLQCEKLNGDGYREKLEAYVATKFLEGKNLGRKVILWNKGEQIVGLLKRNDGDADAHFQFIMLIMWLSCYGLPSFGTERHPLPVSQEEYKVMLTDL